MCTIFHSIYTAPTQSCWCMTSQTPPRWTAWRTGRRPRGRPPATTSARRSWRWWRTRRTWSTPGRWGDMEHARKVGENNLTKCFFYLRKIDDRKNWNRWSCRFMVELYDLWYIYLYILICYMYIQLYPIIKRCWLVNMSVKIGLLLVKRKAEFSHSFI